MKVYKNITRTHTRTHKNINITDTIIYKLKTNKTTKTTKTNKTNKTTGGV